MSYKTILVHLDASKRSPERAAFAIRWAQAHESHLVGLVPSGLYDGSIPAEAIASGPSDFMARSEEFLRQRSERISRDFRRQADDRVPYDLRLVDAVAVDAVVRHGRSADLVILGQHDAEDPDSSPVLHDLPQQVLMEMGCPVLVLPYAGSFEEMPRQVVIAWDGSREASMAVRGAVPALRKAASVTVVSYGRTQPGDDDEDRLLVPQLLQFLHHHGVQASAERDVVDIEVGDALLSRLADLSADMLVMGGYAHSRFRELILGGTTRRILQSMTVPVLMAH